MEAVRYSNEKFCALGNIMCCFLQFFYLFPSSNTSTNWRQGSDESVADSGSEEEAKDDEEGKLEDVAGQEDGARKVNRTDDDSSDDDDRHPKAR